MTVQQAVLHINKLGSPNNKKLLEVLRQPGVEMSFVFPLVVVQIQHYSSSSYVIVGQLLHHDEKIHKTLVGRLVGSQSTAHIGLLAYPSNRLLKLKKKKVNKPYSIEIDD